GIGDEIAAHGVELLLRADVPGHEQLLLIAIWDQAQQNRALVVVRQCSFDFADLFRALIDEADKTGHAQQIDDTLADILRIAQGQQNTCRLIEPDDAPEAIEHHRAIRQSRSGCAKFLDNVVEPLLALAIALLQSVQLSEYLLPDAE